MRKFLVTAAALVLFGAVPASAHTISIGSFNAGSPGSVTLVMGTYDHGSPFAQGAIQLIAGPSAPSGIVPFSSVVTVMPGGLIDGDNNFYADSVPATWGTLPADSYHQPTNTVGIGPVVNWQGATFTGLTAGLYTYQLSGMTSQNWNNINSFTDNWTGTLLITETSTVPTPTGPLVPEPASLVLFGTGLLVGLRYLRRRRAV